MSTELSRRGAVVLSAVCLACLMFGLEISSIPAILPTLEQVLHADFKALQWIMNAYTIAVTTVLMAIGTVADRYGRKRIFLVAIAAFGITSLICGVASSVEMLIVARFLQGLSGGALLICQIAVLSHEFQGGRLRAVAWGWWGVIFGIGLGFGPIIGGAVVAVLSWEWVFLVHVLFAAVAFVLTIGGVHESKDPKASSLDVGGIVTMSLAVFCLAFYITQGPDLALPAEGARDPRRLRGELHCVPRCRENQPAADVRLLGIPDIRVLRLDRRLGGDEPQLLAVHDLSADLVSRRPRL